MDDAVMSPALLNMSPYLKRSLHWGGTGLALIGVVFVGFRLHYYWLELDFSKVTPLGWSLIAALAMVYGSANLLLALAWWHLLRHFSASATRLGAIRIYGMSQLAKYVPGNIFHLAGRQALGMAAGISAGVVAKSMIWELGLIAVAGTLFGWIILPLLVPDFMEAVSVLLMLASAALVVSLIHRVAGRQPAFSFIWQMCFLLISGAVFVILLELVAGGGRLSVQYWMTIVGANIAAWLVGFVTPGAPAGVGVREFILLLLLKELVTEVDLLMAVLINRLVTVVGDVLFFVAAFFIPTKFCAFRRKNV